MQKKGAARYDAYPRGDEAAAVAFLLACAQRRPALEFAIGLAATGVRVDGIERSPHMRERLRAKPGGEQIAVTLGDMSRATTGRRYGLVYLVFNTIFNLLNADDQVRCFENAARHLTPDGQFLVETALPHVWIAPGKPDYVYAEQVGSDTIVLDVARYDPVTQLLTGHQESLDQRRARWPRIPAVPLHCQPQHGLLTEPIRQGEAP